LPWHDGIGESDMSTEILYHGTNGDNILAILKTGDMTPKGGEIFFGSTAASGISARTFMTKLALRLRAPPRMNRESYLYPRAS
jgi:hypothetical protein